MVKSNKKILDNVEELKTLVEQHNKRRWRLIPLDERKFFLDFQKVCNKRYEEREAVYRLLNLVWERINNMIVIIENGLKDPDKIDYKNILEFLNSEKQIFLLIAKAELQKLGFEVKSLEDVTELEDLNQVIFNRHFLDQAKYGRKITSWNKRIRRIALIYAAVFYIGFQITIPVYWTGMHITPSDSTKIHHVEIYKQLEQSFSKIGFKSYDNIQLSGILVKNKANIQTDKVMLLVHGRSFNANHLLPYVKNLRTTTNNIDFLAINLRYHGPDTPYEWLKNSTFGEKEALDVVGAINDLAARGYKEVVVYGNSVGGAAVINALGNHSNLLSKEIGIKGVIVEKTFASSREFALRSHENVLSNLGYNLYSILSDKEKYPDKKILPPSDFSSSLVLKLSEQLGGFSTLKNEPYKAIRKINVPVMVIGNKKGDAYMTAEDVGILAKNAKHGIPVLVQSEHMGLKSRHIPEFNNPVVISKMVQFINGLMR